MGLRDPSNVPEDPLILKKVGSKGLLHGSMRSIEEWIRPLLPKIKVIGGMNGLETGKVPQIGALNVLEDGSNHPRDGSIPNFEESKGAAA